MHLHILGICGTFMGGIAQLASQLGYRVSGSDNQVYPPMSTQLEQQGIRLSEGYEPAHMNDTPDLVVIGNALSRGNTAVEYVLNQGLPYLSGPDFLAKYILPGRWVLAVAGTHGKTTTSSMLAWILEDCGLNPGFLIGGVSRNFPVSARLGQTPFFVVEADEYDSAFFDKRSKFIHYRPRTLVLNNLEFDHADIFDDLEAIKRQFHHLVRTIPGNGLIISAADDRALEDVLARGCWTPREFFVSADRDDPGVWNVRQQQRAGQQFDVYLGNQAIGTVHWSQIGQHNIHNALAAIAAARHVGVPPHEAIESLGRFQGVKRRLENRGSVEGCTIYDDFAHHPTAIASTVAGLRQRVGAERIIAVLEPRSNTMRLGKHKDQIAPALALADEVLVFQPAGLDWELTDVINAIGPQARLFDDVKKIVDYLHHQHLADRAAKRHILIMSNGGFDNIHQRLLEALQS